MDAEDAIYDRGRGPEIRGTRITVYNVMDHHLAGKSTAWIAQFYGISEIATHAAVDYIDAHLGELMPKYDRDLRWARTGNPPHIQALFAESHQTLMRLKENVDRQQKAQNAATTG